MLISWILTTIAITGAILNSQAKKEGFYFWLVSNSGFFVYNAFIGEIAMSALFLVYLFITINGIKTWSKQKKK